jgi:dual specificity tyrosine-phosphorylation-regulated kinase 2/3/4
MSEAKELLSAHELTEIAEYDEIFFLAKA